MGRRHTKHLAHIVNFSFKMKFAVGFTVILILNDLVVHCPNLNKGNYGIADEFELEYIGHFSLKCPV